MLLLMPSTEVIKAALKSVLFFIVLTPNSKNIFSALSERGIVVL